MRTLGSSSSATSPVTNGTSSSKAGRKARCTTAHEYSRPLPDTGVQVKELLSQRGHCFSGYQQNAPHESHFGITSSPRAAPAKNSAVRLSSKSGRGKSGLFNAIGSAVLGENQGAGHTPGITPIDADLAPRYLSRRGAAQL